MKKLSLPLLLLAGYMASPFVTLWQLSQAARTGDIGALSARMDWDKVRNGLKQDIEDGIAGQPMQPQPATVQAAAASDDDLPPFGSSFVRHMAGNIVDRAVSPERLAAALSSGHGPGPALESAFFTSPTSFEVALRPASEHPGQPPVRLKLRLEESGWKVTRVWVPQAVLQVADSHTS
jgi:hypothetical protein